MKNLFLLVFLCIFLSAHADDDDDCRKPVKCPMSEYNEYQKCLNRHRIKRSLCGMNSISPIVVQAPIQSGCSSPCMQAPCPANCPQQIQQVQQYQQPIQIQQAPQSQIIVSTCKDTCLAQCTGLDCSERCDSSCNQAPIPRPASSFGTPNVTTVIRLTNIVNNTNIVNVPTSINNTNINNISSSFPFRRENGWSSSRLVNENEKCCSVVQPKICQPIKDDVGTYRCVHRRHRSCGSRCISPVMHAQVRQPCNGTVEECPPKIVYIPEPKKPRCVYTDTWPYVSCANNHVQKRESCDGCYDHYGYGFQNYHGGQTPNCTGCYDDGFKQGDLYRKGPFHRPGYYHVPPCYLTGTCNMQVPTVPSNCEYEGGCFGHEMMDPAFGVPSYSPYGVNGLYNPQQQFVPQPAIPQSFIPTVYVPQPYVPQAYVPQPYIQQSFLPPAVNPYLNQQYNPYIVNQYSELPSEYPNNNDFSTNLIIRNETDNISNIIYDPNVINQEDIPLVESYDTKVPGSEIITETVEKKKKK